MNISTSQKNCKYMMFYNFLLQIKLKSKKETNENAKMWVINRERDQNDDREKKNGESEREQWMIHVVIAS